MRDIIGSILALSLVIAVTGCSAEAASADSDSDAVGVAREALAGTPDLRVNEVLGTNQALYSSDGRSVFAMQGDGNLVLYHDGAPLWATNTGGGGAQLVMQGDGNLVVYAGGQATWSSRTNGRGSAHVSVQTDCNVVIYSDTTGRPVWASNTAGCQRRSPTACYEKPGC